MNKQNQASDGTKQIHFSSSQFLIKHLDKLQFIFMNLNFKKLLNRRSLDIRSAVMYGIEPSADKIAKFSEIGTVIQVAAGIV